MSGSARCGVGANTSVRFEPGLAVAPISQVSASPQNRRSRSGLRNGGMSPETDDPDR
jgi:hypothetical protein